ncbi:hypothetical protein B1H10_03835 [candidate division KSB1 bacterium 4484_188]|nr:MAG: hypothetical protein B1H10_03835 [candidate division KSB1 bacterium 4484_188]
MATHSLVKIYVHLIWGTLSRERILNKNLRISLFKHYVERAKELSLQIEKMNIQPEHVHILLTLPADQTIAQVSKNLKGESSHWINDNNLLPGKFNWQRGYGAFSVSASQLTKVKNYIASQEEHHKKQSFYQEYKEWAKKYGVWYED